MMSLILLSLDKAKTVLPTSKNLSYGESFLGSASSNSFVIARTTVCAFSSHATNARFLTSMFHEQWEGGVGSQSKNRIVGGVGVQSDFPATIARAGCCFPFY